MMAYIDSRTVALIRAQVAEFLTDSALIEKETMTRGTMGEKLHDWVIVSSAVACRVITAGSRNRSMWMVSGGQETIIDMLRVIVPYGTSVGVDYRVTVNSEIYRVVDIEDNLTNKAYVALVVKRERAYDG